MDYRNTAAAILKEIGGKENIVSAAHCATRLRMVIADNGACSKTRLEKIDGVKGVFEASGQLQIILGTGVVNKVYDELIDLAGIQAATKDEVKQNAAAKQNIFLRAVKTLGDVFVPIIPAIVASGLLMGLLEGLCNVFPSLATSTTYTIFHLFSNAAFVFLPILIAISAAKVFGGNIMLGAVIGMIMIHSDLMNAWSVAAASSVPKASVWFGLYDISLVGYQGHVIPVVIAVWIMCLIEKKLHKIVPEIIDLFVTPLVTVTVTGYLTLTIIGPVFSTVETWVLDGARYLITLPFGIGAFLIGGLYAVTVVAGLHHMYNAIEAGLLSSTGLNIWMPIATAANVAQGAAALAIALKTKDRKTKSMALPASLSAFMGITEPAIFGVNIRYMRPFIAGCIGGAVGGLFASIMGIGATAYGITGIFGFLITTNYLVSYALTMVISAAVAFVLSWILYKEKEIEEELESVMPLKANTDMSEINEVDNNSADNSAVELADNSTGNSTGNSADSNVVNSPCKGKLIALNQVPDETFASGTLGEGVAVIPEEGMIRAPFDGEVTMLFDTHHAIGLTSDSGVELLIHVGINTVELDGKYFKPLIEDGARVTNGMPLLQFDMDGISKAGYDLTTPIIITNCDEYSDLSCETPKNVVTGDKLIRATK